MNLIAQPLVGLKSCYRIFRDVAAYNAIPYIVCLIPDFPFMSDKFTVQGNAWDVLFSWWLLR